MVCFVNICPTDIVRSPETFVVGDKEENRAGHIIANFFVLLDCCDAFSSVQLDPMSDTMYFERLDTLWPMLFVC
jgi:hypothetical protein